MIKLVPRNEKELFEMLDDLIADIKEANKDVEKTRLKQKKLMQEIDEVEAEFNKIDRELKWIFGNNIVDKTIGLLLGFYIKIFKRWL
jgi:septal ring factor EnvC (AmiA/AmiB activator)